MKDFEDTYTRLTWTIHDSYLKQSCSIKEM